MWSYCLLKCNLRLNDGEVDCEIEFLLLQRVHKICFRNEVAECITSTMLLSFLRWYDVRVPLCGELAGILRTAFNAYTLGCLITWHVTMLTAVYVLVKCSGFQSVHT